MLPDGLRVVNMTIACDRSVNVRCGVAPFAPARWQLTQDFLSLLHPLLGLDVRSPGLPGRTFDGGGHCRDLPDSLLLVAIEAFRIGRIEIQRLLLLEIPPASRSEEHTSELQSRTLISYAVFCLKKKNESKNTTSITLIIITIKKHI